MITIDNISFSYGKNQIFKDFNLQINKGDRLCLFGQSGCGKTTLLRLILGLEKSQKGKILKSDSLRPSVVFQENLLLPFKTVLENITLFGADEKKALEILEKLGIKDYANQYPKELSGGMQRRVALARALSCDFNILVLDEPFTGLDNENISAAAKCILNACGDKPIILVTHSLEEAKLFNSQIVNL